VTTVHHVVDDGVRIIMCLAFDHRAPVPAISGFKTELVECKHVVSCCDLHGTFDFMIEVTLPDLPSYNGWLDSIRAPIATLVARYETNFVCNRLVRVADPAAERVIWVPCQDGIKRIDSSLVDKVKAEGDYMRVHADGSSWLVHLTMRQMIGKLGEDEFVQLHRSTVVRVGFVDRLIHRGRLWTARLNDASVERIARSHLADVMARLRLDSPNPRPASPKPVPPVERPFMIAENLLHR
jgi:hypothetical protein